MYRSILTPPSPSPSGSTGPKSNPSGHGTLYESNAAKVAKRTGSLSPADSTTELKPFTEAAARTQAVVPAPEKSPVDGLACGLHVNSFSYI